MLMGEKRTVLPFGPQHPVLPEPIQLRLVMEDEKVVEALPAIGYVHRGLERLVSKKDFNQMIYVVERICGICSFMHGLSYAMALEEVMDVEVPDRAKYLRVIWGELHRLHSHFLWLGLLADAFGFESLFMQCWRIREQVMDIMEETAGNRVIISTNIIGGVRRDIGPDGLAHIRNLCDHIEDALKQIRPAVLNDYTVKKRTVGVGVLSKEQAYELGAVGPVLRASGVVQDIRQNGYAAYGDLQFAPVAESDGDCYARLLVRFNEMVESVRLLRLAIVKIPEGEINTPVKGKKPEGEAAVRVEQPRGEVLYYVKGNGTNFLDRVRVRTPTFANVAPLLAMLPGCQLADVPVIILSIDPCISCTER